MSSPVPGGERRSGRGIQTEVLVSLAAVMLTATALLAVVFMFTQARQVDRTAPLLGRALVAWVRSGADSAPRLGSGVLWWDVGPDGVARETSRDAGALDAPARRLAAVARRNRSPQLRSGAPWEPIRFAVLRNGSPDVLVAQIPAAVPGWVVLVLLVADVVVFTALGATLLRRRVVLPLRRVAEAAQLLADGATQTRVPVEGVAEAEELARAFNNMGEALERRTGALEKAIADLRDANRKLRRARAGIERAERLAAVGRLAAGVAHEVGNPMGAVLAFIDLVGRDTSLSDASRAHLVRAGEAGGRVRSILRQLLDFSRPPRARAGPVDLVAAAEQAVLLVGAQSRYVGIDLRVERVAGARMAWADEGMVVQILLNLLLNAADAVRGAPDPQVLIRVELGALHARAGDDDLVTLERQAPDAAICEVSDNGPGVSIEDRERVFDPFFTSKSPGEGTGLGLSTALRLAEEQGGSLELRGAGQMRGASFLLRLPVAGVPSLSREVRTP